MTPSDDSGSGVLLVTVEICAHPPQSAQAQVSVSLGY